MGFILRATGVALVVTLVLAQAGSGAVLTTVRAIRQLTAAQAKLGQPISIHGVVTSISGWKKSFFMHDGTAGISVDREDSGPAMVSGQAVEITGVTGSGLFAPVILSRQVTVLGSAALPPAHLLTWEDLASGRQDSQWVELRGVVQSAVVKLLWGRSMLFLGVESGGRVVEVRVVDVPATGANSLVDATVCIRGVCGSNFNRQRQYVGALLFTPNLSDVLTEQASPADPFSLPLRDMNSVLDFKPGELNRHRVRVKGYVTYQNRGKFLYLQLNGDGIRIRSAQNLNVPVGALVEAVGFPAVGDYSPVLNEAVFRIAGAPASVQPLDIAAADIIRQSDVRQEAPADALLVTIKGRLREHNWQGGEHTFLLQSGGVLFDAHVDGAADAGSLATIKDDSLLAVTGICSVHLDENREPRSFSVLLRSPADLVIEERPSWWSIGHMLQILAAAVVCFLLALAWVRLLQLRVREATAELNKANHELKEEASERKLLESQLVQAQKLESIGQLASGIAHEVNTPIQYIGDNCFFLKTSFGEMQEVLKQHVALRDSVKSTHLMDEQVLLLEKSYADADADFLIDEIPRAIDQSIEGVERVAQIVRAMKEFSHPGSGEKVPVDLNHAIQNTLIVCRNEVKYGAKVVTNFDATLPPVPCHGGEFNQVILNLVVNAAHAIESGKNKGRDCGTITITTRLNDGFAEIRIQDDGSGIPEEIRGRIFDPFFTTKEVGKGTGQGLAIARNAIVKKHGGTLTFETEENVGTMFIIRIPLEPVLDDG